MIGEYVLRQDSPMSRDTDGTSCSVMALICVIDNVPCRSIIALPDGPLKFGAAAYRRFIAWASRRSLAPTIRHGPQVDSYR